MGRPAKTVSVETQAAKSVEKKEEVVSPNLEDIIAKAIANARKEWEKEVAKPTAQAEEETTDIPDSLKLEVVSNVISKFFLKDSEEHPTLNVVFGNYGDKQRITLEQLRSLRNNKPRILEGGMLAIKRVVSEAKKYSIQDVYEELSLTSLYDANGHVTPLTIENLFAPNLDFNVFSAMINERLEMYDVILELAYDKYRKGQFNDNAKMNFFRQVSNNQNLFK
jgi:hypothetical protein